MCSGDRTSKPRTNAGIGPPHRRDRVEDGLLPRVDPTSEPCLVGRRWLRVEREEEQRFDQGRRRDLFLSHPSDDGVGGALAKSPGNEAEGR